MQQDFTRYQPRLLQLVEALCRIPAPTGRERARALFCSDWLRDAGFDHVLIDEADNVICPVGVDGDNDVVIFMAHMDTVFPDTEPMEPQLRQGRLYLSLIHI